MMQKKAKIRLKIEKINPIRILSDKLQSAKINCEQLWKKEHFYHSDLHNTRTFLFMFMKM